MARQALTATAQILLPENTDVFEGVKRAESARNVLLQAQAEIQKTFPDFAFKFEAGSYRDPNAPRRGRMSAADKAAKEAADKAAADAAAAAAANGSDANVTAAARAPAGGRGSQPTA